MAGRQELYEKRTEALLAPIADRLGLEIVDVEYVREGSEYYLRAYIDKPGGVSVNDCEAVSDAMNPLLDREDFIPDAYIFEVSSPGLTRPLKKEKDYIRNTGKPVEIHLFSPRDGQKEFTGTLASWTDQDVTIDVDGQDITFGRKEISLIRQAFTDQA